MEQDNKFEALANSYRNPTKFSIIVLLAEQGKMTVTQMSQYISVSRSNLYHFVSQLLEDGILNEPEVIPKKNYVEKFYSLNEELFKATDYEQWGEVLKSKSHDEIRSLLSSVLLGYSMMLNMAANRFAHSSDDEAAKLKDWLTKEMPWCTTYSLLSRKGTESVAPAVKALDHSLSTIPVDTEDRQHFSRLLIVFLPFLGERVN